MIVLDENILEDQRQLLLKWNVPIRQIGYEVGRKGMKDDEIIPFEHGRRLFDAARQPKRFVATSGGTCVSIFDWMRSKRTSPLRSATSAQSHSSFTQ